MVVHLPMLISAERLGSQHFLLADPNEAFQITCYNKAPADYEKQLRSLLRSTPLTAMHWINIDVKKVVFKTIN